MSFYLFRRYFLSSRSGSLIRIVSWICLGGIAVSVAALILIVSIMGGFGKAIKSRLLSKEAHLVIHFKDNPFLKKYKNDSSEINKKSVFLNRKEHPIIFSALTQKQKDGVKEVSIFENQELILKGPKIFKGVSAIGYPKNQWDNKVLQTYSWTESNLEPNSIPLKSNPEKEVLLSHELSFETGLTPGDELTLIPLAGLLLPPSLLPPMKKLKVKGVLQEASKGKEAFSIYYKQGSIDFGDFSNIKYGAEIKLHDPEQVSIYQNLFKEHTVESWIDRNSTLFFALKLEKFIMTLFLILALVISCLGISSALFLLITQKGEDLAILHAMGLSQKEIVKVFTGVGLYLSFIGLFAGAFIGLSVTVFLRYNNINFLPEMYQDRTIPTVFLPFNYLIILLGSLLLAWISCYLPTRYLSHIKPAELLKITNF